MYVLEAELKTAATLPASRKY